MHYIANTEKQKHIFLEISLIVGNELPQINIKKTTFHLYLPSFVWTLQSNQHNDLSFLFLMKYSHTFFHILNGTNLLI